MTVTGSSLSKSHTTTTPDDCADVKVDVKESLILMLNSCSECCMRIEFCDLCTFAAFCISRSFALEFLLSLFGFLCFSILLLRLFSKLLYCSRNLETLNATHNWPLGNLASQQSHHVYISHINPIGIVMTMSWAKLNTHNLMTTFSILWSLVLTTNILVCNAHAKLNFLADHIRYYDTLI